MNTLQDLEGLVPKAGDVFDSYELIEEIGRGGTGSVYRARQTRLDHEVAVKVLLPHVLPVGMLAELSKRFDREIKILRQLQHPHIVRISDAGHTPAGFPYYAMELIEGHSLADELALGPVGSARAVRIGIQIAQALAVAHGREVIHRDLKPGNIMLRRDYGWPDYVTVLDFGIAKLLQTEATALTMSLSGTPWYMAPEQALMQVDVDGRVDVYALGVILAECVSGTRVVETDEPMKAALRHALPEPLVFTRSVTESPLFPIIERATAKATDERYASAQELEAALLELEPSLPVPKATPLGRRSTGPSSASLAEPTGETTAEERAREGVGPTRLSPTAAPSSEAAAPLRPSTATKRHGSGPRLPAWLLSPLTLAAVVAFIAGAVVGLLAAGDDADTDGDPTPSSASVDDSANALPAPSPPADAPSEPACDPGDPTSPSSIDECLAAIEPTLRSRSADGDPRQALARLEALCDEGHQSACVRVATALHYAQRVPPDPERAARLYASACEAGWPAGCVGWARLTRSGRVGRIPDDDALVRPLEQACESGELTGCAELALSRILDDDSGGLDGARDACERDSGLGCYALGVAYGRGLGARSDAVRAAWYFREACELGALEGCTALASQLDPQPLGEGGDVLAGLVPMPPDRERSQRRLLEACDGFEPVACYRLALRAQVADETIALLTQSCDGGYAPACQRLADRYAEGRDVEPDLARATHLGALACLGDVVDSCVETGQRYEQGTHVESDLELAGRLYEIGCRHENLLGCRLFASLLAEGAGVAQDLERAYDLFDRACDRDDYPACHRLGLMMVDGIGTSRPRPESALRRFRRACDDGDIVSACHRAGLLLAQERGRREQAEARERLERSCDAEAALGCYRLGRLLAEGVGGDVDLVRAVDRYERACEHADMDGCVGLALAYASGEGRPLDLGQSYAHAARACAEGHPRGCWLEGVALRHGRGVTADVAAAAHRFERACRAELPEGCYDLGRALRDGVGRPVDHGLARSHLALSCDADPSLGCDALGLLVRDGLGGTIDLALAAELFERACDAEVASACDHLARAHVAGAGVEMDGERAARLFERACESRYPPACTGLAQLRYSGVLIEQDLQEAVALFRQSCDDGYQPACSHLGHALLTGVGVERDTPRAMALIRQACDGGVDDACEALQALRP